jgi:Fic family protein
MDIPRQSRSATKKKRKRFKARWVKLTPRWAKALGQTKSVSTYQLAHIILFEAFKCEQTGGEVVLSATVTGMPTSTRKRAIKELVKLKLIKVSQRGNQAVRVVSIL